MRAILGIIAGLIAGFIVTILIGIVGVGATYTPPAGMGSDPKVLIEGFAAMPAAPKIALMVAWFGGAIAGAWLARKIAGTAWPAWTVTGLIALYVVFNTLVLPLPGWMQALSIVAPLLGGLVGLHLVRDPAPVAEGEADGAEIPDEG